jgi:hypothetical protein
MLRKFLFLISIVVLSFTAKAQNLPTLKVVGAINTPSIFPDTIYGNQLYTISLAIQNVSTNNLTYVNSPAVPFTIKALSDSTFGNFELYSDSSSFTIAPGDTLIVTVIDTLPSGAFKLGNNVVVVWPSKSGGFLDFISDSTVTTTYYAGTSSIREYRNQKLLMYPNPFNQSISIDFAFEQRLQFYVYDLSGRMLFQQPLLDNTLDLSFLKEGIYFMELRKQGLIISRNKMIKF